jgi:hypothetical protein
MTMTADAYIARVLNALPPATPMREQIALELRGSIDERLAAGQSLDAALTQLGDPRRLAESYLTAVPLRSAPFFVRGLARLMDFAVVTVVIAPVAIGLWLFGDVRYMPWGLFLYLIVGSMLVAIYPIVAEARYGQTIGKHVFGLRVVTESGTRITWLQALVRTSTSARSRCCRRRGCS